MSREEASLRENRVTRKREAVLCTQCSLRIVEKEGYNNKGATFDGNGAVVGMTEFDSLCPSSA